ncbi:type IV pilus secretin PilQ family protein [Aeromonas media]|uniref:Type IV pilus secretin PilQ family protein n=1 Tax=Aeromonas media TaxID=651 RepID=A0A6M4YN91_AERME|nr:type IV pilus secretin PilQ family protein [Aeromonas media]QJT26824.1 type IV pilus secretin PilQ family protein [Aeromonas media]QJT29765.1 type IV pilus secretin PilQ family protein [Aeromonas media]QJT35620.1 type IV pilus secretin PilQ family protein [Aeromonas media]QJT37445.1 type IV pilus secretin PilQ family protein [Aeromonas media]WOQ14416.1 type IV pilus secretin PilQ family protein [Aeromonas media]
MRTTIRRMSGVALLWLGACVQVWAVPALQEVRVNPLLADQLLLELSFSEPVSGFTDRLSYEPNQLLLHVPGAIGALTVNPLPIKQQGVDNLKVEGKGEGLDIKIALDQLTPYQVHQQGNKLLVSLGEKAGQPVAATTTSPSASPSALVRSQPVTQSALIDTQRVAQNQSQYQAQPVSVSSPVAAPAPVAASKPVLSVSQANAGGAYFNSVKGVDFRRGKEGQGEFLVTLDNSSAAVDVSSRGQKVLAKFHGTRIPDEQLNLINVQDFATPVSQVEVFRQGNDTLFELSVNGQFDYRYDQADKMFIIEVKKRVATTTAKQYQGKPISLNFQDIPVRTVLQIIADFNNLNLVTTDSVSGNITLRLDGVPWEQALDIILKVRGLDKRLDNNILLVAPADEIAAREKQQLESRNQVADLAPLYTEYLQINYAKASEVAALLSSESTKLLSPRGAVSVDERTNVLVVKDTADVIGNVKRMLDILDIPVKQVVIEARMVTIDDGFDEALGVRWGVTKTDGHGNGTSGTIEGNDGAGNNDGSSTITRPGVEDRLNVNLPVTNAAGTLAFQVARLANGTLLDLELSALEKESKAEIIASPRVTTANQKPALIEQGTEIPYVESSSSGATSVTFKKAVLSLKVTPQITPDNRVILDLTVTQDTKGETVPTGTGDAVSINAQSITTQVLVNNGETLVLGGIYQQTIKNDVSKVPLLGDIPGLGYLFKKTTSENKKRELLIFVTPRIVTDAL